MTDPGPAGSPRSGSPWADQHLLVTGGSGFIGRAVIDTLIREGARVTVVDRHPHPSAPTIVGELTDPGVRDQAVHPGLTGIIHLAAVTSVLGSLRDPSQVHAINVTATAQLLELARCRGVPRFALASTNAVTGDVGVTTIHEDLPLRPLTPYGATKAAAEMLLSGYAGAYGMTCLALRFTNVYGPGMAHKDSMVPRLMRAARSGAPIEIYGSGAQRRDLVHVRDVVAGLSRAWAAGYAGPLIIGSGRAVSVLDLVAMVREVTGRQLSVRHVPAKPGEMPAVLVDITRARALGYRPSVSLRDGLASVWGEGAWGEGAWGEGAWGEGVWGEGVWGEGAWGEGA